MSRLIPISRVADQFGMTLRALRFYEQRGLLSPRREGKHRLYDEEQVAKVARIQRYTRFGFSIYDIGEMLKKTEEQCLPALLAQRRVLDQQASDLIHTQGMLRILCERLQKGKA